MKTCPYCAEKVKNEAEVCRYCNGSLVVKSFSLSTGLFLALIAVIILGAVGILGNLIFASKSNTPVFGRSEDVPQNSAYVTTASSSDDKKIRHIASVSGTTTTTVKDAIASVSQNHSISGEELENALYTFYDGDTK